MKTRSFNSIKKEGFDISKKALLKYGCSIVSSNFSSGKIEASKNGGLLSYGHEINVSVKSMESGKLKISISSNSVGPQVIDWGSNSNNEIELMNLITQLLK